MFIYAAKMNNKANIWINNSVMIISSTAHVYVVG